jgi:multicomponent Na+:H+ antiporter subunit A
MAMAVAILSGGVVALAAPGLHRLGRGATGWILAVLPLTLAIYFASCARQIATGEVFRESYAWAPSLGVQFSFYLDGLGLLFALIISGIGALVFVYAGGYMAGHRYLGRFYAFLMLFMSSMLGVVLADNILTMYVFWELTSLTSYLLIGFDHQREEARKAAWQALLVTSGGGLAMLAGLVLLGQAGGTMELSGLVSQGENIRHHPLYLPILLLILVGAFTKSAQFPFHFWLPAAMEAPTPVSAYLHSATMVKAGVYLLARLSPALGGTEAWWYSVTLGGMATVLCGGYLALYGTDLKRILAYSTISALGTLVMFLGVGSPHAVQAVTVFLLAHALYKGALFMVAGAVDHETGTRDADRLGGLRRAMPITATAAVLAALSLAAIAPLFGFIGKEMLLEAALESPAHRFLVPVVVMAGALFVAVAAIVGYRVFFREFIPTPKPPHEAPPSLWLGPLLMAMAGLVLGLFPALASQWVLSSAMAAVLGWREPYEPLKLSLWHGLTPALALSAGSILLGVILYAGWNAVRWINARLDFLLRRGPAWWYDLTLEGLNRVALAQTRLLQSGYLRYYIIAILATAVGLVGYTLVRSVEISWRLAGPEIRFYEAALAGLLLLAALAAVRAQTRLAAVAALGVVGYTVALVFILFGAPDLAMTQFAIETLTVILFVLVLYRLPRYAVFSSRGVRIRDAVVALIAGSLITALVLAATQDATHAPISQYFAEHSVTEAHGRNIVNVILVDFRSFDTLGEITVLAVAAMGVYALLKLRLGNGEDAR